LNLFFGNFFAEFLLLFSFGFKIGLQALDAIFQNIVLFLLFGAGVQKPLGNLLKIGILFHVKLIFSESNNA
jgi:hypothetical protein